METRMRSKRLNKATFYEHLQNMEEGTKAKLWVLPKGGLCAIIEEDGINILENGNTNICKSDIIDLMADHGIKGEILIDYADNIAPTIPSWIRYFMSCKRLEDLEREGARISVTTLGSCDIKPGLPFVTKSIMPVIINVHDIHNTVRELSQADDTVNLFIIEMEDGTRYNYEPHRIIPGIITGYTEQGYTVSINNGTVIQLVDRVNASTRNLMNLMDVSPKDMVGSAVEVQYTSFTGKNYLRPYKAAMVVNIPKLRSLVIEKYGRSATQTAAHTDLDYVFDIKRPTNSSVITPTRLSQAGTYIDSTGSIIFTDRYNGEPIAAIKRGKVLGSLGLIIGTGDREEQYTFTTIHDSDSLSIPSFRVVVGRMLWERHGINIVSVGLYHTINDVEMIGRNVINNSFNDVENPLQFVVRQHAENNLRI